MLLNRIAVPAAALAVGLLVGCTQPIAGQPDEVQVYPKITLSEEPLKMVLGFKAPIVTRTASDLMQVTQPIRARSDEPLHLEYRFVWLDALDQPIRPPMSWKHKRLEPRQPEFIQANATSPDAVDYNIQVRWAKP